MKKKLLITALVAVFALCLVGCSDNQAQEDADSLTEASLYWMNYKVPANWSEDTSDGSFSNTYKSDNGSTAVFSIQAGVDFPDDHKEYLDSLISDLNNQGFSTFENEQESTLGNSPKYIYDIGASNQNGDFKGKACFILNGHALYYAIVCSPSDLYDDYSNLINQIVESINFDETSEPLGSTDTDDSSGNSSDSKNTTKDESKKTNNKPGSSKDNPVKFTYDWYKGNSLNREGKWTVAPCMITNSFQYSGERYLVATLANDDATLSDIEILVPPSEDGITDDIEVGDVIVLLGTTDEMMKVSIGNNDLGFIPTINPVEIEVAP